MRKAIFWMMAVPLLALAGSCNPGVHLNPCPDGGTLVNGTCSTGRCGDRQCPPGFYCDEATTECKELTCVNVVCDPPLVCSGGRCYPTSCSEQNPCPGEGDVCIDNTCVSQGCVGVQCPPDQVCAAGKCYPTSCSSTKPCPGVGEVCIEDECVQPSCAGVTCPAGQTCANGRCYPSDCNEVGCYSEFEVCVDGRCVSRSCANVTCPPNQACSNGQCFPVDCGGQNCWDYGQVCYENQCVWQDCIGVTCPAGQTCARGSCQADDCGSISCPADHVCYGGVCVKINCVGVQCPAGQICADGECMATDCSQTGCGPTEVCVGGQCVPNDCAHISCPAGQTCAADLQCYPEDCATPCQHYEVCVSGVCTDQLCLGVTCTGTQICIGGQCREPDCGGTDCAADEVCENGICVKRECAADRCCPPLDCLESNQCQTFACQAGTYTCLYDTANRRPAWALSGSTCTDVDPCTINDACTAGQCQSIPMPCDDGEVCVAGVCRCNSTGPDCQAGETCCVSIAECHDLNVDMQHCGACGRVCQRDHASARCQGGVCSIDQCNPLWDNCDGQDGNGCETSLETLTDCGTCRTPCGASGATTACDGGVCHITSCDPGFGDCDGSVANGCENTLDSLTHCGACNTACARTNATASCAGDVCHIQTCNSLWDNCNGIDGDGCETSLETLTDCAACRTPCVRAHATATCQGGTCRIAACNALWANCNGQDPDGCETSLETLTDCGSCNTPCQAGAAQMTCTGGICQIANCDPGFGDCDGNVQNGCENTLDSLTDCGACRVACARANATPSCAGDICHIETCDSGFGNCDGIDGNGCEDTLDGLVNCGACGTPCARAHATATCAGDVCRIASCNPLWDDCNAIDGDGCETSLETLTDCGACATPCSRTNATASCAGGSCHIQQCSVGFGNCDGIDANGCENTLDSLSDCGACGIPCSRDHATASCAGDVCHIASCIAPWDNCDGQDGNGCETDLNTNSDNCGSCRNVCGPNAYCNGGACACNANFANCNGSWADGCEIDLRTNHDNCGFCGNNCGPNATCSGGACGCNPNFANCNGSWADGCEVDLRINHDNCGSCGNNCGQNATCSSSVCTCNALWGNCNATWLDGCETPTNTLVNCGGCGIACDLPHATENCSNGSCEINNCDSLWGNCNGVHSDGCETQLTSLANCGGCGVRCDLLHASESCDLGFCQLVSCDSGWWNIDGDPGSGCECGDGSDAPETCAGATNLGTVSAANPQVVASGVIAHRTGYHTDQDCFWLTYNDPDPAAGTLNINLSGSGVLMTIWRGGCGAVECLSDDVEYQSRCSSIGGTCQSGNSFSLYICIHASSSPVCSAWTLTAGRS